MGVSEDREQAAKASRSARIREEDNTKLRYVSRTGYNARFSCRGSVGNLGGGARKAKEQPSPTLSRASPKTVLTILSTCNCLQFLLSKERAASLVGVCHPRLKKHRRRRRRRYGGAVDLAAQGDVVLMHSALNQPQNRLCMMWERGGFKRTRWQKGRLCVQMCACDYSHPKNKERRCGAKKKVCLCRPKPQEAVDGLECCVVSVSCS